MAIPAIRETNAISSVASLPKFIWSRVESVASLSFGWAREAGRGGWRFEAVGRLTHFPEHLRHEEKLRAEAHVGNGHRLDEELLGHLVAWWGRGSVVGGHLGRGGVGYLDLWILRFLWIDGRATSNEGYGRDT